jgi:hypothetical protein
MPEAAAFCSTWSGRVAPTIADATFGCRSTHASASCAVVTPSRSAIVPRRCTASRMSSRRKRPTNVPMLEDVARESGGGGSPGRYLPVRTP